MSDAYVSNGYTQQGYMEGQYPFDVTGSVVVENFIVKSGDTIAETINKVSQTIALLKEDDGKDRIAIVYNPLNKRTMMVKDGKSADVGGYLDPAEIGDIVTQAIDDQKEQLITEISQRINVDMKAVLADGTVVDTFEVEKLDDTTYSVTVPQSLRDSEYDLVLDVSST